MSEIQRKTSGLAIASLVLGCFFLIPLLGFITSLLAIIFGIIALVIISNKKEILKGNGLAISGIILGVLGILIIPIIALLAAIAVPNFLRARMLAYDAATRARIQTISSAIMAYTAANDGKYPLDMGELTSKDLPYLPDSYKEKAVDGYKYSIEFTEQGYKITAEPESCSTTGTKVFMDENGIISEKECR